MLGKGGASPLTNPEEKKIQVNFLSSKWQVELVFCGYFRVEEINQAFDFKQ